MEIYTVYVPAYWASGIIKALTAVVSVATAYLLLKLVSQALALPSPVELQVANEELRKANTALQESDEALRKAHEKATTAILERISDGFVTFDRDWRCLCVNSAAARFLRKSPEELLGKVLWAVGTCAGAIKSAQAAATGGSKPFEALISDIGLPDGSGLDVAREIKVLTSGIKAIALSGYGTDGDNSQQHPNGIFRPPHQTDLVRGTPTRFGCMR